MQQTTSTQGWHVANWGTWGWLETAVKLIGIGAGILAFLGSADVFILANNPRLAAIIVLGLLTLALLIALVMRVQQREIISMGFVILNVLGHAGLLIALLRQPVQGVLPLVFGVAFVIGELVKQHFLVVSGYTEAGQSTPSMVNFSRGLMVIYALFMVLMLV